MNTGCFGVIARPQKNLVANVKSFFANVAGACDKNIVKNNGFLRRNDSTFFFSHPSYLVTSLAEGGARRAKLKPFLG